MLGLVALILAAGPVKLVAPSFSGAGIDDAKLRFFTARFAHSLRAEGVELITSDEIAVALGIERQRELLGCADQEGCLTELGNALGTSATVKGTIAKIDETWHLQLIVLGNDAKVQAELGSQASSEKELLDALDDAAAALARQLGVPRPARLRPQAWVPGLLGLLGGGIGGALVFQASTEYRQLTTGRFPAGEGERVASSGSTYQLAGLVALGAGAALLVTAVLIFVVQELL